MQPDPTSWYFTDLVENPLSNTRPEIFSGNPDAVILAMQLQLLTTTFGSDFGSECSIPLSLTPRALPQRR